MSCESWVEPRQHGEEPGAGQRQDTQHVRGDSQQTMDDQGQSDEEEKGSPAECWGRGHGGYNM